MNLMSNFKFDFSFKNLYSLDFDCNLNFNYFFGFELSYLLPLTLGTSGDSN